MADFFVFAFALSQVADVISTKRGIASGLGEKNPLIRFLMSRMGKRWAAAKLLIAVVTAGAVFSFLGPIKACIVLATMTVLSALVAIANFRKL